MMTNTENITSKLQITAIIIMATGWGWNAGNFTPPDASFLNYLLHGIPILLLLVLSLPMLRVRGTYQQPESKAGWTAVGMSVFAIATIIAYAVMIVLGASNPDPNAFGVKTLADWFPTTINIAGSLLWLMTLILSHYRHVEVRTAINE
jgi:hypothetical protein